MSLPSPILLPSLFMGARNQSDFWKAPMEKVCRAAGRLKASDVMHTPSEGEYIKADAPLRQAPGQIAEGLVGTD